jgi:hypothetical protein
MAYPPGVCLLASRGMKVPVKLAAFAAALGAAFGLATLAGATLGPDRTGERSDGGTHAGTEAHSGGETAATVRGLAVSSDGLGLALERTDFERGRRSELRFAVTGPDGAPVREFDVEHERRMHVIVVRRDGGGFQHLHPELGDDGTWSVPLTLPDAGAHRVFADFSHDGMARTLAADLTVDGDADYRPLPAPATTSEAGDGYEVRIEAGRVTAGEETELAFEISRDGEEVAPEPYLGARGHLVALREGDLAFLHVHPDEDTLAFMAEFPSAGRYRLYLQFRHAGRVHTAAFTQEVSR